MKSSASWTIMQGVKTYLCSSIGKKQIVAATGLVWSGFVLMHMAGNLLIMVGPETYNKYGHAMVSNPLLIPAEVFLVVALVIHVCTAIWITLENRKARPTAPHQQPSNCEKRARFASRSMILTGLLLLVFVIYHLNHFKFGTHYTTTLGGVEVRDLHKLIVEEYHEPVELVLYFFALTVLGMHLSHGVSSLFQTFGLGSVRNCYLKKLGWAFALIVALGFVSQPIFILFNLPYLSGGH